MKPSVFEYHAPESTDEALGLLADFGADAKVLAEYQGDPGLVEQGRHLVATFHPELTADARVHRLFLAKL